MTAWRNQGLAPAAGSVLDEAVALATGRYPGWVYGRRFAARGPDQEVPVFVFHDTPAQAFEEDLAFLAENGYRTIDCEELVDWRAGRASIPERAVLLALDDGRESVWQYAYPLLRKYGMRATTFLIPGYMRRRPRRFPNLEDVWRGACTPDDVARRPTGHYRLLYWEEAREMQESGYVDCQSHSLFHHPVFRDDRLTGFLSGDHSAEAFHDWPVSAEGECLLGAGDLDALVGSPV